MTAVVKDWDRGQKMLFSDTNMIPNVGILAPTIEEGLPAGLTATTGMDAFTHAVEAIHTLQASPIADAMALQAIRLIYEFLPKCVEKGSALLARGQQQCAATMAGVAFDNAQVGLPHALAHSMGGLFKVPHGLANSIVLPHSMRFNMEEAADRYALIARTMGLDTKGKSDEEAAEMAIVAIEEMSKKMGIPQRLRDAGVPESGLIEIAELALSDGAIVYNPRLIMEADEIMGVLKAAY